METSAPAAEAKMETKTRTASGAAPETWEPRIAAFVCRWCTYAGADLAGTSRLKYPPQIRVIKLPCTGRIDPLFLLRAFAMGADGILVSGCHPGDCHYTSGNYAARRRWTLFRELLDFVGLEQERVHFSWVSAAEGAKFVEVVKKVTEAVRGVGPFPGFDPPADARSLGYDRKAAAGKATGTAAGTVPRTAAAAGAAASSGKSATGEGTLAELERMRADLTAGKVKAILGHRAGRRPGILRACWLSDPARLGELVPAGADAPSLAVHLVRRLRQDPEGAYGIVARPTESAALLRLGAEQQVDPARVQVYPQSAPQEGAGKEAWERYGVPGPDAPAKERRRYWNSAFSRCLRCYACREGCPMCSCLRCVADKTRPRWIDSSPSPAGNWVWNVTRAFHQAGRCVECGTCTAACPVGIPLGALGVHLNNVAEKAFGPRGEGEKGLRSPLLTFSLEDREAFIL